MSSINHSDKRSLILLFTKFTSRGIRLAIVQVNSDAIASRCLLAPKNWTVFYSLSEEYAGQIGFINITVDGVLAIQLVLMKSEGYESFNLTENR